MWDTGACSSQIVVTVCSTFAFVFLNRPRKSALFQMDLILDETVHFSTDPEAFCDVLVKVFNNAVMGTWNIPQLEKVWLLL